MVVMVCALVSVCSAGEVVSASARSRSLRHDRRRRAVSADVIESRGSRDPLLRRRRPGQSARRLQ